MALPLIMSVYLGVAEAAHGIALEVAGGHSFFRSLGLERPFRDVQGARYHPLPAAEQVRFTGRLELGQDPVG